MAGDICLLSRVVIDFPFKAGFFEKMNPRSLNWKPTPAFSLIAVNTIGVVLMMGGLLCLWDSWLSPIWILGIGFGLHLFQDYHNLHLQPVTRNKIDIRSSLSGKRNKRSCSS